MTDATPEQLEMAWDISNRDDIYQGVSKQDAAFRSALSAIIETSERAAKLAEDEIVENPDNEVDENCNMLVARIASTIRSI